MSKRRLGVVVGGTLGMLGAVLGPALLSATWQAAAPRDALAPVAPLVGRWSGTTEGQPGKGTVEREYERILGARFIQARNRSTYPPQEKNPKGEVHEDLGIFSFDSARKRIVLRQFHIENIPAGWRARETLVFSGPDQVEEIFELAEPGKDFEVYSRNRLTRVR